MSPTKKRSLDDVPRPACSGCGEPAHHRLEILVHELVLDRDAGTHARAYWTMGYGRTGTSIQTNLCPKCVRQHVTIAVDASATIEKGSAK